MLSNIAHSQSSRVNEGEEAFKKQIVPGSGIPKSGGGEGMKKGLDENIKFTIVKTIDFDYEELIVISLCNTIISANSTFSIWAGYLSGHSNVYLPSQYKKDRYLFEGWKSVNEFNND